MITSRPLVPALLLVGALGACARPEPAPAPTNWADLARDVRPTLEQVFLEPPVSGVAPAVASLSADGRFALLRWGPPADLGEGEPPLRLLDVDDPGASDHRGVPLADLLPAPELEEDEEAPEIGPTRWTHHGALLAVARGSDLFLVDPVALRAAPFLLPPVAAEESPEEEEDSAEAVPGEDEEDDADEGERRLHGKIKSLRFAPDDRSLRFIDGKELYALAVPLAGLPGAPRSLDDAEWLSEKVDPLPLRLQWSRDLTVVFGHDPTPIAPPEGEEEEAEKAEDAEEAPAPQVLHLDEDRSVVLADMAGMQWLENADLSPDGRFVVGAEFDRETEPEPTIVPDFLAERVTVRETRRLLADDGPSPFELWMWDASSGERMLVFPKDETGKPMMGTPEPEEDGETETEDEEENGRREGTHWLRRIGWSPDERKGAPARFAYELYSADFRELEIWCWTEGFCERVWFERDERWIGGPIRHTRWNRDGSRLLVGSEMHADSSTPGRAQLFAVDPEAGSVRQLTEVAGEVRSFHAVEDGGILFTASQDDPGELVVGWIPRVDVMGTAAPVVRYLPLPTGWNTDLRFSRDGLRVVVRHEELLRPGELHAAELDGSRRLTRTVPKAFESVAWIRPKRIAVASPDGATVRAHVYLPPGSTLAPGGNDAPRASIVFVHGAGYLQNVTDSMTRYPLNALFHSRLAHLGYPVIDVDYRGSAGYGRDFRTDVQYHLGGKDLDDIHLVVDELVERGLVDPDRVGIYGGSYGGFMTLMALSTAPERWTAGAALRSVTDWRTYHPRYTQPRLGRPSTHAEAYAASSPIDHVEALVDPVLILHGMMDSNVFAQDSIRYIEALIDQGADFEAMLYPSQGHGFEDGSHWLDEYRRIERFLLRHLGPPESP